MSNEDYRQGYRDGFKDGLEEAKKSQPQPVKTNPWGDPLKGFSIPALPGIPYNGLPDTCPKCGINLTKVMGYVCHSPNCPTFPQVTCGVNGDDIRAFTTGQFSVKDYIDRPLDLRPPGNYMDLEERDKESHPSGYR